MGGEHLHPLPTPGRERVLVLAGGRGLFDVVGADHAGRARAASLAAAEARRVGSWDAAKDAALAHDGFGRLMLAGGLVRRVGREGRFGPYLLSAGDLLRPWQHDGEADALPF